MHVVVTVDCILGNMDESEVTVLATQSIAGFVDGETVTIVRSTFVDRLIAQESLVVVGEPEAVDEVEVATQGLDDAEKAEQAAAAELAAAQAAADEELAALNAELTKPKRAPRGKPRTPETVDPAGGTE